MAKAMIKSLPFFVFFALFLVIMGVSKIEAQDEECKKVYEDFAPLRCLLLIFPPACYTDCRIQKGALSGKCVGGDRLEDAKCICDFCHDPYSPDGPPKNIMEANAV